VLSVAGQLLRRFGFRRLAALATAFCTDSLTLIGLPFFSAAVEGLRMNCLDFS
jgi:hypothetical protein